MVWFCASFTTLRSKWRGQLVNPLSWFWLTDIHSVYIPCQPLFSQPREVEFAHSYLSIFSTPSLVCPTLFFLFHTIPGVVFFFIFYLLVLSTRWPSPYPYRNREVEFAHSYLSIFSFSHHLWCVLHFSFFLLHTISVLIFHPPTSESSP